MKQQPPGAVIAHQWHMVLETHPRDEGQFLCWWQLATKVLGVDNQPLHVINALEVEIVVPMRCMISDKRSHFEFEGRVECFGRVVHHSFNKVEAHQSLCVTMPKGSKPTRRYGEGCAWDNYGKEARDNASADTEAGGKSASGAGSAESGPTRSTEHPGL